VRLSRHLGIPADAPADPAADLVEITREHSGTFINIPEFATGVMEIARDLTPSGHDLSNLKVLVIPSIDHDAAKKALEIPGGHPASLETSLLTDSTPALEETSMEITGEFPDGRFEPSAVPPIPWSYGECRITALVRDPYWLFAYWEIGDTKREEIARRCGHQAWSESCPVLRLYDVTNLYFFDSRRYSEISINDYANNWYIRAGQPNRTFCIELGRVRPDGSYIFLARSNFVSTPRDQISEVIDEDWLLLPEYAVRLCQRIGGLCPGPSSAGSMGPAEYLSSPGFMGK
jgi:hypothetical protein